MGTAETLAAEGVQITVGFSTTSKLISRLIRFVTRSSVSHAWVGFYDPLMGTKLVMQAEAWGYEVRPWKRWKRQNKWVAEFGPLRVPVGVFHSAVERLGSPYDFWSAGLVGLKSWLKRWVKTKFSLRPSRSPSKLMCSESVVRILKEADFILSEDLAEETTSPMELLTRFRESAFPQVDFS